LASHGIKNIRYICHDNLKYKVLKHSIPIAILFFTVSISGVCLAQTNPVDSLKSVLSKSKIDTVSVNAYNHLANYYKDSNIDSTRFYAQKAASMAVKTNYGFGLANAYINLGNFNLVTGNYKVALHHFQNAQLKYESLLEKNTTDKAFKNGLARAFASAGIVYTQQNNYYMALENYQKALKIYQEVNQKTNISKVLNNIGIVYKSQLNYPKALEYLKKAYQQQQAIGEPNTAMTLTNIGVIYFETKQYSNALQYYLQAQQLFEKNNNPLGNALLNNYLGDYYANQNDVVSAEKYYQKSIVGYEAMSNKFGASLAIYNLGKLYTAQKKYADAMPLASKSLAYAKEIGVLDQIFHSEKLLSELYGFQNNTEASFAHYKNYIAARDSIANQEANKKFAQAAMNYEYQKKEALLTEKGKRQTQFTLFIILGSLFLVGLILLIYNQIQVKRRLILQKEVAEYEQKALHLQMNPHFVFNCLGAISSFIVQNGTDSALKYLSKFSKLMRLTLEYSKGSLIPIDKEIESLQNYLELEQLRFNNKFQFAITSSDKVEFNMGLPPLLVQPFVENAILHGMVPKEGNGRIDVTFDVQNDQLVCSITDDGIGLIESKLLKENSMTAHQSMAMEITKKRLKIMESTTSKAAQIDIEALDNNHSTGTKVTLRLPIQYIP
jgi:tetratricopeptide (TPR) repeat protein